MSNGIGYGTVIFLQNIMNIKYPEHINAIITRLLSSGHKAYIVGGCVRDCFLNKTPNDYDITTDALPNEVINIFSDYAVIPTGLKHGTVTIIINNESVEITTFRFDGEYTDHRRPSSVNFSRAFQDDAMRRDFTVNAMAYNYTEGVIDLFGGQNDIKNKTIRTVGDPDKRFNEDALRILRALRFSSTLNFEIEPSTAVSIHKNKDLLGCISSERIYSEFTKLLCGTNVRRVLIEYYDVIACFIPEILPTVGFDQHNFHHIYDVWQHTAVAVENIKSEKELRLAAFFHDIGKPKTFSLSHDGIGHFYGHSAVSADIAQNVLKRLKADNDTISTVTAIIKYHDLQIPEDEKIIKRHMAKLTPDIFFKLIAMFRADTLALSPDYKDRESHFSNIEAIAKEIMDEKPCLTVKSLAINGNDIINLGIKPGKQIGEILNILLDSVISCNLPNTKQALLSAVEQYITQSLK